MFENERALFVGVTTNACRVGTHGQPGLLGFKAAVRIVAIAAVHCAFEDLVVKRLAELSLCF